MKTKDFFWKNPHYLLVIIIGALIVDEYFEIKKEKIRLVKMNIKIAKKKLKFDYKLAERRLKLDEKMAQIAKRKWELEKKQKK